MKKRAQMEMIGLVVIVILITLGMLFMARFALKDEPAKKIFVRKGLAYSTMGALMKTELVCDDRGEFGNIKRKYPAIDKLIMDCAEYHNDDYSGYGCGDEHTCLFLEETITDMLNNTLGKWGKHYEFHSKLLGWEEDPIIIKIKDGAGKGCPGERDTSGLFPINTDVGMVENILYLCD